MKNLLIIGAGIHGTLLSIELKKKFKNKINVDLIEKNKKILAGTSFSTHNRANRGFHYPRSSETAKECQLGWNYFIKHYKDCFFNIGKSYYLIEKNSRTSKEKFEKFLINNNLGYTKKFPKNIGSNKTLITESFEVFEGCFNHKKLTLKIQKQIKFHNVNLITNFEVKNFNFKKDKIILSNNKRKIYKDYDLIVNSTYADAYKTLKLIGINKKNYRYKIQNTIVPVVYSKKKIPGLTIIDGPYCTIMPYASEKNTYLLYDVKNSVSLNKISNKEKKDRYIKMKKKLNRYFFEEFNFKLKKFFEGKRPIPLFNPGDRRSTLIKKDKIGKTKIISICEGKYISAPYIIKKIANSL